VNAACVGVFARQPQVFQVIQPGDIERGIKPGDRLRGSGDKFGLALRQARQALAQRGFLLVLHRLAQVIDLLAVVHFPS
jgi:hypothetical protein